MPAPVRVRDTTTGHEYSTYAVDDQGRVYEDLTVLKGEKAVDDRGNLLPPKYPTAPPTAPRPTDTTTGPKATPKES
jgi:hypothetical protein